MDISVEKFAKKTLELLEHEREAEIQETRYVLSQKMNDFRSQVGQNSKLTHYDYRSLSKTVECECHSKQDGHPLIQL